MQTAVEHVIAKRYEAVAGVPRPRPLRRTDNGKFVIVLTAVMIGCVELALLAYIYLLTLTGAAAGELLAAHKLPIAVALFLPFSTFIVRAGQRQQSRLIADGEVAIATVTGNYVSNREHRIVYAFEDKLGRRFTNETTSTDNHVPQAGQQMLIYYAANDPKNAVLECVAFYQPEIAAL